MIITLICCLINNLYVSARSYFGIKKKCFIHFDCKFSQSGQNYVCVCVHFISLTTSIIVVRIIFILHDKKEIASGHDRFSGFSVCIL